jgi:thiamine biosynthesis lipoprotein
MLPARRSRRRALTIFAAAAGSAVIGMPFGPRPASALAQEAGDLHRWRGQALGARASLLIHHPDQSEARRIMARALDEIDRLEAIFSLYRDDSALVRLNREGSLEAPPLDLVELLGRARRWSRETGGAFDVTVQPLWDLYRRHFSRASADPGGPDAASLAEAHALVDYRALEIDPGRIVLVQAGMAVTVNGIAQGYICDRVAELFRGEGLDEVLIDLGEIQALGSGPDGRPWQVGLADPRKPEGTLRKVDLVDRAVATSAPLPTGAMPFAHILDPQGGRPAERLLSASVVARRAADADALSTALVAAPEPIELRADWCKMGIEAIFTLDRSGNLASHPMARA